eukprot:gene2685-893_t
MAFLSAWCGAFIWLFAAVSFAESTKVSQDIVKMLQEEVPLQLHFCKSLGYKNTSKVNFMKQTQQSVVKQDSRYKALQILSSSGCSDLVKPYTCAIYAPPVVKPYGALPPCRSLCTRTEKQCEQMMKVFKKVKFFCNYFSKPSKDQGCIDFQYNEDEGMLERIIRGTPTAITEAWEVPTY